MVPPWAFSATGESVAWSSVGASFTGWAVEFRRPVGAPGFRQ